MENGASSKIHKFFGKYPKETHKRGTILISATDTPLGVYLLSKGYVKQYSISTEGKIKAVNIFKAGSFFPMMWAFGGIPNEYYYEAMSEIVVQRAPRDNLLKFVKRNHVILEDLLKRLMAGVNGLIHLTESLMYDSARKKLVSFLLMLSKRFDRRVDKSGKVTIDVPLTHHDIASFTGMIRETVSYDMKRLQKQGILEENSRRRTIVIKDIRKLEAELG